MAIRHVASTNRIEFGADTDIFRTAANTLKTDDTLQVGGNLDLLGSLLRITERASTPGVVAGVGQIYVKSGDNELYYLRDTGSETVLSIHNAGGSSFSVVTKTGAYTVIPADNETAFTTTGAVGTVTITILSTTNQKNYFTLNHAGTLVIKAPAGVSIKMPGGITSPGGTLSASVRYSTLSIYSINSTTWGVLGLTGTWIVE